MTGLEECQTLYSGLDDVNGRERHRNTVWCPSFGCFVGFFFQVRAASCELLWHPVFSKLRRPFSWLWLWLWLSLLLSVNWKTTTRGAFDMKGYVWFSTQSIRFFFHGLSCGRQTAELLKRPKCGKLIYKGRQTSPSLQKDLIWEWNWIRLAIFVQLFQQ